MEIVDKEALRRGEAAAKPPVLQLRRASSVSRAAAELVDTAQAPCGGRRNTKTTKEEERSSKAESKGWIENWIILSLFLALGTWITGVIMLTTDENGKPRKGKEAQKMGKTRITRKQRRHKLSWTVIECSERLHNRTLWYKRDEEDKEKGIRKYAKPCEPPSATGLKFLEDVKSGKLASKEAPLVAVTPTETRANLSCATFQSISYNNKEPQEREALAKWAD